jgi:hypothetical protein
MLDSGFFIEQRCLRVFNVFSIGEVLWPDVGVARFTPANATVRSHLARFLGTIYESAAR